jgi:hypothetical protein
MKKILLIFSTVIALLFTACSEDNPNGQSSSILANKQVTGSSANDLLSDNKFTSLYIELVYVEGNVPTDQAVNNLKSFLQTRLYKPNGIIIEKRSIPAPGNTTYTTEEIAALEDEHRTVYNTANQIAVWAFFADAKSSKDTNNSKVLGTAYRNTSMVVFENTLKAFSDSPNEPSRSVLETTILEHEFCHLLGLTNLGTPMVENHEDTEHEKHCDVESCLMYWSAEAGTNITNIVSGGTVPQLDSQCIADLQANGGK